MDCELEFREGKGFREVIGFGVLVDIKRAQPLSRLDFISVVLLNPYTLKN